MKKLVFLFMSRSSASPNTTERKIPTNSCGKYYIDAFKEECYFKMLEELLKIGVIDKLDIFYESNIQPGLANWINDKRVYSEVIPEIRFVKDYIDDDSIIFVRGGFKHWYELLLSYKSKNWLMLYAANTGREKWPFWDIILNDTNSNTNIIDTNGRYYFRFIKPTNEEVFYYKNISPIYDACIGASHIHDKKGQYHALEAIKILNEDLSNNFSFVMPGAPRGGLNTNKMFNELKFIKNVNYIGYVSKPQLCDIFNMSKLFIHMGNHGQNDRSVLEALACGTPVVIKSPMYHDFDLKYHADIFPEGDNPLKLANYLKEKLKKYDQLDKERIFREYKNNYGFKEIVIPRMARLLNFMFDNKPNINNKRRLSNYI